MLGAVKSGVVQGIYKADQQKPAMMAKRHGTTWWEIVPRGSGAIVFEQEEPPMIVFRPGVAGDRQALATALDVAWEESATGQMAIIIPPPSLGPCPINLEPVDITGEVPKEPKPKDQCVESIPWESYFPAWWNECFNTRAMIEVTCGVIGPFGIPRWLGFLTPCEEITKVPMDKWIEDCVVSRANTYYMLESECGIPGPGSPMPGPKIRQKYRAWKK